MPMPISIKLICINLLLSPFNKGETASVADDVGEGLFATLQSCKSGNALMDLFWEEQKKAFTTSPKGLQ